jgi:hypothetical protein
MRKDWKTAMDYYQRASRAFSRDTLVNLRLAFVFQHANRTEDAGRSLMQALRNKPPWLEVCRDILPLVPGGVAGNAFLGAVPSSAMIADARSLLGSAPDQRERETARWVQRDILEITRTCREHRIPILLLNYPRRPWAADSRGVLNQALARLARERDIPFVDIEKKLQAAVSLEESIDDYFFSRDAHCSGRGYGVMAEAVYQEIVSRGWIPIL